MFGLEILLLPFFARALIVGLCLGVLMATLGILVVLRQMSFFSDAIGHSALTGIALGILLHTSPFWGALGFSMLVAGLIVALRHYSRLKLDTILGILFPSAMALGVILLRLTPTYRTDLVAYLFGDILTVTNLDIATTLALVGVVAVVLVMTGKKLFKITLHEDLAKSEGINVAAYELLLLLTLAAVIAMAIKLVGIVLVTAMLIIPAATAQNVARSLTAMFITSVVASLVAVTAGMFSSALFDIPSGPAIVLAAATLCLLSFILWPQSASQRGSILLITSLLIFVTSLAAASFMWYQLRPSPPDPIQEPTPTTEQTRNLLSPAVTIAAELTGQRSTLQTNLIGPLRQHYATQNKRLTNINIQTNNDEAFPAKVTLLLTAPDAGEEELSFLYDLTPWTPSMFDNQPKSEE